MTQPIPPRAVKAENRLFVGGPADGEVRACTKRWLILTTPTEPWSPVDLLRDITTGGAQVGLERIRYDRRVFGVTGYAFPVMTVGGRAAEPVEVFRAIGKALQLPSVSPL